MLAIADDTPKAVPRRLRSIVKAKMLPILKPQQNVPKIPWLTSTIIGVEH